MHLVTLASPLVRGAYKLAAGSYLADNVNAGEILARHPTTVDVQPAPNPAPIAALTLDPAKPQRILVIRAGGFGDLLFLTPVFRALKRDYPLLHIAVACFADYAGVFAGNPDIAEIVPYPVPLAALEKFDAIVPLENTVEHERELHAVDRYLTEFGIPYPLIADTDKACIYHMTDAERIGAVSMFQPRFDDKGDTRPRLGVQAVASTMARTYPHDQLAKVCELLHRQGWEIYFFGEPKSLAIPEQDGVVNLSLRSLTFRQSAAVLATCDVVLAPDSALAHLAGALDLPCVALYGPFPWQIRTAYHPKTLALSAELPCAPCFHQVTGRQHFPANGPCAKTGKCEALSAIKPTRIAAKIDALYKASLHIANQEGRSK